MCVSVFRLTGTTVSFIQTEEEVTALQGTKEKYVYAQTLDRFGRQWTLTECQTI